MDERAFRLLTTALALIAANYGWQFFTAMDWHAALERSWFQVIAIFVVWITPR